MLNQILLAALVFQDTSQVTADVNSGLFYLMAAYAVVWLFIFGYLYSLNRRQNRLREEINLLKQAETTREEAVRENQLDVSNPRQTGG